MPSKPSPVKAEASYELPFPPELVWPVLSKTDWLNRSAGLPPVSYSVMPLPEGGTRVWAKARFCGLSFEWEEKPFEWCEPEFYRVGRSFARGPIREILVGIRFERTTVGIRMCTFTEIYARNFVGTMIAKLVLAPEATRGMGAIASHVSEYLRGHEQSQFPKLKRSSLNESAFEAAMRGLHLDAKAIRSELTMRLEKFLRVAADVELSRLRPFAVARHWNADRWEVLQLFLRATRAGLLDLTWEVLCPNCRSTRAPRTAELADLKTTAHCEVCQIKFDAEFDKSVELKFSVNQGIRACAEDTFCLAGPGSKPHVLVQLLVPPAGSITIPLPRDKHALRLRSPQVPSLLAGAALQGPVVCDNQAFRADEAERAADIEGKGLSVLNRNAYPVVIQVERSDWSEDILTAACVTSLQEFRDLFARQVISPSERIVIGQQIILFTDLRGSTATYCGLGDAAAYAVVRDHFEVLRRVVAEGRGAVVKTIGDAVMAVFTHPREALEAVWKMHHQVEPIFRTVPDRQLKLKSSLHLGPCLAVNANERLDYFGTTVNLAARLVDSCHGRDLVLSDQFYVLGDTQEFVRDHNLNAERDEIQFRGFSTPTPIWRVPCLVPGEPPPVQQLVGTSCRTSTQ